ncbi:MAG TPA: hypothetical protein VHL77_09245, partial [Ferruginibacter sp.]|nr:hypothetical protein [Ferruginibacter sp.]
LHPQKGRFVIEPPDASKQASGGYLVMVKNSVLPDIKKVKLSSRGKDDLQSYFTVDESINDRLLLIGETRIIFDTNNFRIKDKANDFFFLQYSNDKGKTIINKLQVNKDIVVIRPADLLFEGTNLPMGEEVFIGFVENYATQRTTAEIGFFKPVSMSLADCKKLMITIKKALGKDKKKVTEETYTMLYRNYGKPDMEVLSAIYDKL